MDYNALFQLATRSHESEGASLAMPVWAALFACGIFAVCGLVVDRPADAAGTRAAGSSVEETPWTVPGDPTHPTRSR